MKDKMDVGVDLGFSKNHNGNIKHDDTVDKQKIIESNARISDSLARALSAELSMTHEALRDEIMKSISNF